MIKEKKKYNIKYINQDKFNSNLLSIYVKRPLNREEVTLNNLLVDVLSRGSKNYPDILTIERELERLYGASLVIDTNTLGSFQFLNFSIQFVSNKFIKDEKFFSSIVDLLTDIVFNPNLVNGEFNKNYVNGEKKNLREKIENEINDKRSYAINRTLSQMYEDEVYGINKSGYLEDLEKIDSNKLTQHYNKIIKNSEIEIYYLANENSREREILEKKIDNLDFKEDDIKEILMVKPKPKEGSIKLIEDKLIVNQGKIVIGYKSQIVYGDDKYYPLLVGNTIFGGTANSKLFMNVREKNSLAYYIYSRIYKYSGSMLIEAGIDFDKFEATRDLIELEFEKMKAGDFSLEDIDLAKTVLESSIISSKDSLVTQVHMALENDINNEEVSLEDKISLIKSVNKEEIIDGFNELEIDVIYFMNRGD